MGSQNAVVFKILPRSVPDAVGAAAGWVGGLGALGGFLIPLAMSVAGSSTGSTQTAAHGFFVIAGLGALGISHSLYKLFSSRRAKAGELVSPLGEAAA